MNWQRRPELLDRLAAEHALGTMTGGARRRFDAVMQREPDVARAAARWAARLQPMDARTPAAAAGPALWQRIEQRAFSADSGAPATARLISPPWWKRWLAPIPTAALSFGLIAGLALPLVREALQPPPDIGAQLPESYVGVLATADGKPGLIVSSLRRGTTVDFKVLQRVPLPEGRQLVLWTLDAQGRAQAVGPVVMPARNFFSLAIAQPAEALFQRAVELALSIEAVGDVPAAPSGPYVYRGLCGKLWPVKPPAAASAPAAAPRPPGP